MMKQRSKKWQYVLLNTLLILGVLSVNGCAGLSARDRSTLIGAGVGGVAGNVLTGGSTAGTVGGAAVGGYIGNQYP